MVLRRIKDRARLKFHIAIAEVGHQDAWQSAQLGFAVVANDRRFVESVVEHVVGFVDSLAKIADEEKDFLHYGDEELSSEGYAHWEPEEGSPPAPLAPGTGRKRKPRAPKSRDAAPFPWEKESKD